MKKQWMLLLALLLTSNLFAQTDSLYQADFLYFWNTLNEEYAYFDQKQTDWAAVKERYLPEVKKVNNNWEFTLFLEKVIVELYDNHTHLNTNTQDSYRLVPSGTDIAGGYKEGRYFIKMVHPKSPNAHHLFPFDEVLAFNGVPIKQAIQKYLPKTLQTDDPAAHVYALDLLLAGGYKEGRRIRIKRFKKQELEIDLGKGIFPSYEADGLVSTAILEKEYAYLRIENSLGNDAFIKAFDEALDRLLATKGLILDLRNTPGGGNSLNGRAVMSRLIEKEQAYQKHEFPNELKAYGVKRSWVELVSPRGQRYAGPLVVLVDSWTGSMGEGLAIGLDGMKRGVIVGSQMAGLLGATNHFQLPNTGIGVSYSAEQLFHVNGQPREEFVPEVVVVPRAGRDGVLEMGLLLLKEQVNKK